MKERENATFTDDKGRVWNLRISTESAETLRDLHNTDVSKIIDDNTLILELISDIWKILEIILVLTEKQREAQNVSEEDFKESLGGDELDEATVAFMEGVANILPKLKRRAIKALLTKMENDLEMGAVKIETKIATTNLETQMDTAISEAFGNSPTNAPQS